MIAELGGKKEGLPPCLPIVWSNLNEYARLLLEQMARWFGRLDDKLRWRLLVQAMACLLFPDVSKSTSYLRKQIHISERGYRIAWRVRSFCRQRTRNSPQLTEFPRSRCGLHPIEINSDCFDAVLSHLWPHPLNVLTVLPFVGRIMLVPWLITGVTLLPAPYFVSYYM